MLTICPEEAWLTGVEPVDMASSTLISFGEAKQAEGLA